MNSVQDFAAAVERFLALPEEEQVRLINEAEARAKACSDAFDQACRIDWRDLHRPMTI